MTTAITSAKITEYQCVMTNKLKNVLTAAQLTQAKLPAFIQMWEVQAGGNGSTNQLTVALGWLQAHPLACKFLTTASVAQTNFNTTILSTPAVTAADALPATYIALHAENTANEAPLGGVFALRSLLVDSTYKDDGVNLGAGTAGNVLSSAYVMGLYSTWGATKFNAIFNKNFLTAVKNETNASYQTVAEVSAVYSAWANTVPVNTFFTGVANLVGAGVGGLMFSNVFAYANNLANFNLYTSNAVATLMGSTGGTWAGVVALSAQELADLTTPNAVTTIKHCNGTFTNMTTVYAASTTKYYSLTSQNSVQLMQKGYTGIDFPGLSTGYGTTYTAAADAAFNSIVDPQYNSLWANGVTYAHMAAIDTANRLKAFTPDIQQIMMTNQPNFDTVAAALVSGTMQLGGLETLGDIA